ncbi:4128_t:CDS:2 [Acaulospora morrowiae]|uniref:4128_t:CDS:1 n=1 Tax=Acaulospora morrowiae TaxID=94023 RepID=A0A9N8WCQ0_9GLOM|nr:4128_t:CDS:2 [Acaulospora morrowiae]
MSNMHKCFASDSNVESSHLQSVESLQPVSRTSPQVPLKTTQEILPYIEDISVILAFNKTISELSVDIGRELANKLFSLCDANPEVWSSNLEEYIDGVLDNNGKKYEIAALEISDEPFQIYCKKVLLDFYYVFDRNPYTSLKIINKKFVICRISSIFKYYEATFPYLKFEWMEVYAHSANSDIVKLNSKATRYSDGLDLWHMDVARGSSNMTDVHTIEDKALRTDVLNLVRVLRDHTDCDITLATKIKVFRTQVIDDQMILYSLNMLPDGRYLLAELAKASIPFTFRDRHQYKAILRMMAIFHDEIEKQEELMEEINKSALRSEAGTVRHVLKKHENVGTS